MTQMKWSSFKNDWFAFLWVELRLIFSHSLEIAEGENLCAYFVSTFTGKMVKIALVSHDLAIYFEWEDISQWFSLRKANEFHSKIFFWKSFWMSFELVLCVFGLNKFALSRVILGGHLCVSKKDKCARRSHWLWLSVGAINNSREFKCLSAKL